MFGMFQIVVMIASLIASGFGIYRGVQLNEKADQVNAAREAAMKALAAGGSDTAFGAVSEQPKSPDWVEWLTAGIPTLLGLAGVIFSAIGKSSWAAALSTILALISKDGAIAGTVTTPVNSQTTASQTTAIPADDKEKADAAKILAELSALQTLITSGKPMVYTTNLGKDQVTITVQVSNASTLAPAGAAQAGAA